MLSKRGFTLIELLIVVAIIAILALIAVPNFLEAQTRSKVARVKADMRTLATAMESYYVDWNSYIWGVGGATTYDDFQSFICLTSPVAYITTIPRDAFGLNKSGSGRRYDLYELGMGIAGDRSTSRSYRSSTDGMPSNTWEMESKAPDHDDNTLGTYVTSGYPMWDATDAGIVALFYDPTNGTVSTGEIFRVGGVPPSNTNPTAARAMQLFFSQASSK
jgi:prepilin-type N-terminal cleavage/methylation domain-containing protein